MDRPLCNISDCNSLAEERKTLQGKIFYRILCGKHHKTRYGIYPSVLGAPLGRPSRQKVCLYCSFDNELALHKHHIRRGKTILLCANCHYILHGMFKTKKLNSMTEQEVKSYLKVTYAK